MTTPRIPLLGHLVRTVAWQDGRKLVSDPMRVVEVARFGIHDTVTLASRHGLLKAYASEVELLEHLARKEAA